MDIFETVEAKQLIKLNERFINVAKTTNAFKNNLKALKICLKLINFETKEIKKSKAPVENEKINQILWRYIDLRNTLKVLAKTNSIQEINKCCTDLENMILSAEKQVAELKGEIAVGSISKIPQKLVQVIGDTAQKLGDTVGEKVDGLKKIFVAKENSKSE